MINFKVLFFSIIIPNAVGFLGSLIGRPSSNMNAIIQPQFTPPSFVFPIVWIILFILMGISSYIVYMSNSQHKKSSLILYGIQLILNASWTIFFFGLKWYLFAFFIVLLIIILVAIMIYKFYKINKWAGLIQIPYLLWLIFAAFLNYNVYLLNK